MAERVWFDIEAIPSGGIAYPEDWKISITPYSFGDVLNLARAPESGIAALKRIVDGVRCNFSKDLLLPADIIYLGLYRKLVSTKHTKIEFTAECPACAKTNKKVIDLNQLKFKEVDIPELPICAELSTGTLEFEPITLGKYITVMKEHNEDPSWALAYSVTNMNPAEARVKIVEAYGEDKEILDEVIELLNFGLEPIEFECEDEFCDNIIKVQLEDPLTVVMPYRSPDESPKRRIKFGHESSSVSEGTSGS